MNQKNLNYEIETRITWRAESKESNYEFSRLPTMHSWAAMNQKNLNYEIETPENKLYSTFPMNQKNLNYEIQRADCMRYWGL